LQDSDLAAGEGRLFNGKVIQQCLSGGETQRHREGHQQE
jgi:hypothetical protein